ncbi:MAG: hypothetical protein ACWGOX_11265 [Desulforhopalus sp.]
MIQNVHSAANPVLKNSSSHFACSYQLTSSSSTIDFSARDPGWETSRYADKGKALFGMWTWDGEGISPSQQCSELGNSKISSHETPLQPADDAYLNDGSAIVPVPVGEGAD